MNEPCLESITYPGPPPCFGHPFIAFTAMPCFANIGLFVRNKMISEHWVIFDRVKDLIKEDVNNNFKNYE